MTQGNVRTVCLKKKDTGMFIPVVGSTPNASEYLSVSFPQFVSL